MKLRIAIAAWLTLILSTHVLAAQQREQRPGRDSMAVMMGRNMEQAMDSMNTRLDSLVRRMNASTGNAKVNAMAQVINELVTQRRAMHQAMRRMMESHHDTMGGPPRAKQDSAHGEHHPQQ